MKEMSVGFQNWIHLKILTLDGGELALKEIDTATIGDIKGRIEKKLEARGKIILATNQRLVFAGQELTPDTEQIGNVENIEDGATIHVVEHQTNTFAENDCLVESET